MMGRMLRWIWKLYPPSFRERFVRELERDLELGRMRGRSPGAAAVADALLTLVRAWFYVVVRSLTPGDVAMDVTHALRALRRAPGYTFSIVSILALALGANTAVFAVTHAVLLRALPYGTPGLVHAIVPPPVAIEDDSWIVDAEFSALPHVETAALYVDGGGANLALDDVTTRVTLAQVTDPFFDVLGVPPLLGRSFDPGERDAVVLSHDLWVRAFTADPDVLGRRIVLSGRGFTVVGVAPDDVEFPSAVDLWLPFPTDFEFYSNAIGPSAIALLRPSADAVELQEIIRERTEADMAARGVVPPPGFSRPLASVKPLRDELTESVKTPLWVLMGIAGLVVVLGCLNLAGLVMSRTAQRMGELSIRRALGASRARLFSQLIAEVLILAGVAGIAGLATASLTSGVLAGMLPAETPGLSEVGLGLPALLFAGGMAVVAGVVVGMIPSLRGAWASERPELTRTATQGRDRLRTQAVLVVGQVAVAATLVVGASLLGSTLRNLEAVSLGYDLERVLTFRVQLPTESYPDSAARRAYLASLEESLGEIPGVSAVGATTYLPLQDVLGVGFRLVPDGMAREEAPVATWIQATRGYFDAIGLERLQGMPFPATGLGRWDQVVITEALAVAVYPHATSPVEEAVGARAEISTRSDSSTPTMITAVLSDLRLDGPQSSADRLVFTAMESSPPAAMGFAVRSEGAPLALADRVREVVGSIDPSVPPFDLSTTGQSAIRQIATQRAVALLSRLFSAAALLLAALGLYGVVSQWLARRRRELGIRLVMGAEPRVLMRSALLRPVGLALVGLSVGLLCALRAASAIEPLLFDIEARDSSTMALVTLVVLGVTLVAAYLPARRIVRIDPTESLRAE